ncbi:MAG TPA: TetR family transcriptional regulator [Myxococcota bacterium]|nr:TetR family transcriptional regulator [Myxococcota bacterium]
MKSRLTADEARQRLVEAATALFRERPPTEVSVRDIAAGAGVNHGLVHRYFGGKDGLLREVLAHIFRSTARVIEAGMDEDLDAAVLEGLRVLLEERWIASVVAHLLQSQGGPEGIPEASMMPVVRRRLGLDPPPEQAAQLAVAEAAVLGWMLFEPLVARGTGLDTLDEDQRLRVFARVLSSSLGPALRGDQPT